MADTIKLSLLTSPYLVCSHTAPYIRCWFWWQYTFRCFRRVGRPGGRDWAIHSTPLRSYLGIWNHIKQNITIIMYTERTQGACGSVVERSPREREVPSSSLRRGTGDVVCKHR